MTEMAIEETELCVVCNKPSLNYSQEKLHDPTEYETQTEKETTSLLPQLRVIFLLQQIFKHPLHNQSTLECMKELGNPSEWVEICQTCCELVDNGIDVLRKLRRYEEEFKRVVEKLERNFSSSYWSQPMNSEGKGNRTLGRNESQQKLRRRAAFRKKIRKIETTMSNNCEIKDEPEFVPVTEEDWNPMEVSFDYLSASEDLKKEEIPNDQVKRKRGRPRKSSNTTPNVRLTSAQERNLLPTTVGRSKKDLLSIPNPKKERSYIIKESESEDSNSPDIEDDNEDPDFSASSDSEWEEAQGSQGRKQIEKNSYYQMRRKRFPGRKAKIESHWFYQKCEEYLDMSTVEYPLGIGSHDKMGSSDWKKEGFPCSSCDKLFRNRFLAIAHIQNVHMGIKKPWKCNKCPFKAKVLRTFQRHIQEHDLGSLRTCTVCGKSSRKSQMFMDTHVINHQKGSSSPTCHECQQSFQKFQHYLEHMTKEHGLLYREEQWARKKKERQVCQHCNKSLATELQLKFHLLKKHNQGDEHDERFPMCTECGDICFDRTTLAIHMARSHPSKIEGGGPSFFCDQCGKEYKVEQDLKLHLKTVHTGEVQKCHICGMEYNSSKTLQSHINKYHVETKDMNSEELEQYIMCKNSEKSFRCTLCSEAFSFSVLLYHHYRTSHPEVTEKFKCDICGKGFSRQCSVRIHKEACHNDEKFSCEDCGKVLTCREGLMQHRRKNCAVMKQKLK